jgi:hypothetical protein
MKHLRETFADQEFLELKQLKAKTKETWHDLIINAITFYVKEGPGEVKT